MLEVVIIHTILNTLLFCTRIYFFICYVQKQTKKERVIGLNPQSGTHYYPPQPVLQQHIATLYFLVIWVWKSINAETQ